VRLKRALVSGSSLVFSDQKQQTKIRGTRNILDAEKVTSNLSNTLNELKRSAWKEPKILSCYFAMSWHHLLSNKAICMNNAHQYFRGILKATLGNSIHQNLICAVLNSRYKAKGCQLSTHRLVCQRKQPF
jgi:hypothetical protein